MYQKPIKGSHLHLVRVYEEIQYSRPHLFLSSFDISVNFSLFYNTLSARVLYHSVNKTDIDDLRYLCLHLIYLCFHFNNYRLWKMSDITKREFAKLTLDDNNYLTWAFDTEIHFTSFDLSETIVPDSECSSTHKAKALIFLRHHLNQDLKNEYLIEKDPLIL